MKLMSSHFHTQSNMLVKITRIYQFLANENSLTPDGEKKAAEYAIMMKITFVLNFPQWIMFNFCGTGSSIKDDNEM